MRWALLQVAHKHLQLLQLRCCHRPATACTAPAAGWLSVEFKWRCWALETLQVGHALSLADSCAAKVQQWLFCSKLSPRALNRPVL
jgi:hypothetical protein